MFEAKKSIPGTGNGASAVAVPPGVPSEDGQGREGLAKSLDAVAQKRRGVKPGSRRGPYDKDRGRSPGPAEPARVAAPAQPQHLFSPEDTALLVELPFNLATIKTRFEGFLLTPVERETLSRTGAVVLNNWVTVDPKYAALILFSLALLKIGGEKTMLYRAALRDEAERRVKADANGGKTTDAIPGEKPVP